MHHTFDPEHLIVNGAGGAFLHPTHVFAGAAFVPPADPAAEATAALYSAARLPCSCRVLPHDAREAWGAGAGGLNALWAGAAAVGAAPSSGGGGGDAGAAVGAAAGGAAAQDGGAAAAGGERRAAAKEAVAAEAALPTAAAAHGHYACDVSYPTPGRSLLLGKKNLHLFRLKNTRCVASVVPPLDGGALRPSRDPDAGLRV